MFSICEGLLIAMLGEPLVLLFFIAWQSAHFSKCLLHYIRQARRLAIAICCRARVTFGFTKSKIDCDELIDELLSAQSADDKAPLACSRASAGTAVTPDVQGQEVCAQALERAQVLQKHRERLAALVGGGQAKQYLGKAFTVDQIDALDDAEIDKLYVRYEARLLAVMTKTLGSAALQLYAGVASMFSQSRPKTSQCLLLTSRQTRLSGMHLAVLPESSTTVMACSRHR